MPVVKALFAGSTGGKLDTLIKRATSVHTKNGPFDLLICVGQFFDPNGDDGAEYVGPLVDYIDGGKELPMPLYFVGAWGSGAGDALAKLAAAPGSRVSYLGRSGVAEIQGLTVAYLDGTSNESASRDDTAGGDGGCRHHTASDVDFVRNALQIRGDVDVLLTNEWPEGIEECLPPGALPPGAPRGSAEVAVLARAARPRYHIAASSSDVFFARQPYLNRDLGAGAHVTRFVGIAPVGNTKKEKWLHALALTPAAEMDPEQLCAVPPQTTPDPYAAAAARRRKREAEEAGAGAQDWRWGDRKRPRAPPAAPSLGRADVVRDRRKTVFVKNVPFAATEADIVAFFSQAGRVADVVRRENGQGRLNTWCHVQFEEEAAATRACQLNGSELMGRQLTVDVATGTRHAGPVGGCWFCLSNADADVDLVVSVGEEAYLTIDKGAITDAHVLVVAVEHVPSALALPASAYAEVERYWEALGRWAAARSQVLVGFERYMVLRKSGGNHCHVNAIAVPLAAAERARDAFEKAGAAAGLDLRHLGPAKGEDARDALRGVAGDGEYFRALLPDGSSLVHPIAFGERHPLNFGRQVLAELAGHPERADWRACTLSLEDERRQAEAFKESFAEFDPMNAGAGGPD